MEAVERQMKATPTGFWITEDDEFGEGVRFSGPFQITIDGVELERGTDYEDAHRGWKFSRPLRRGSIFRFSSQNQPTVIWEVDRDYKVGEKVLIGDVTACVGVW